MTERKTQLKGSEPAESRATPRTTRLKVEQASQYVDCGPGETATVRNDGSSDVNIAAASDGEPFVTLGKGESYTLTSRVWLSSPKRARVHVSGGNVGLSA